jgi:hypothetical protein
VPARSIQTRRSRTIRNDDDQVPSKKHLRPPLVDERLKVDEQAVKSNSQGQWTIALCAELRKHLVMSCRRLSSFNLPKSQE